MDSHAGFVHLRVHTAYSLSEGAIKPEALIDLCKKHRLPAVAVTDSNNLFAALEFSKAASYAGIQPIIGCVVNLVPEQDGSMRNASQQVTPDRLVLYAKDEQGYLNLLKLVSQSYLRPAGDPAPLLTLADVEQYNAGLIALTGGPEGAVNRFLASGRADKAKDALVNLQRIFGDRLYIELQRYGRAEEDSIEEGLFALAYELNIPLVATNDCYFSDKKMYEAHDALLCIADGRYVMEDNRRRLTPEHYFKSPVEMRELFADVPEAIANTLVIARRCAFMSPARKPMLPNFTEGGGQAEEDEFRRVAREGLQWRLDNYVLPQGMPDAEREAAAKPYWERLEFELDTIVNMKFPGYFLIVSDFIRWSKEHRIPVGPGRGSGAGSLVAWAMQITDLDPLRFGLLFERFLNPERVSMPDFDIDFCQDRRDEVIRYVQGKYGTDRVAQIITFGKLQARAALRDVGRVLHLPYPQVDKICKLVPNNPADPVSLQQAIDLEPMLKAAIREDEQVQKMVDIALALEGLYRHASTHAAGVVIADRPLDELVPLYRDPKSDMPVVQFSMKYAEMAGLVKFDFLGLKTLTVLVRACDLVAKRGIEIDLLKLPLEDPKTYAMLGKGDATGVFQLESAGMRDTLRKMKPDCIEDIIALVALYRPGPMENIPTYIARKHGREKSQYPHPLVEETLKETFGVVVYQEQVMQVAQRMAGYSLGQADILRRAMGKKIKSEMDAQRGIFVEGALANGIDEQTAVEVFDLMEKFANYGFNKSHAAAYALIAFQTAYMKANYPVEFLAASMALDAGNTDKLGIFRQEISRLKIALLPPNINRSGASFTVEMQEDGTQAIRYALGALKNVGAAAMESVVAEREAHGAFTSLFDFARRLDSRVVNRRQLEYLVKAGAFDALEPNRRRAFEAIDMMVALSNATLAEKQSNQVSLFGDAPAAASDPALPNVAEWPLMERLNFEYEAIGFYLSAHPLDSYGDLQKALNVTYCDRFASVLRSQYESIKVAGVVVSKKVKVSRKGRFAFLTLTDPAGVFEVSIFDEVMLASHWDMLEGGTAICITADGKLDDNGARLIAQSITRLDDLMKDRRSTAEIHVGEGADILQLKTLLGDPHPDRKKGTAVTLVVQAGADRKAVVALPGTYALNPMGIDSLKSLGGVRKVTSC
ncbi:MAG: DNA polymerase III subunit alpha [Alphaproteobacteria bacterium]|nr:DNA polymerase III subunit alpha [Alphaproteobacteria bacterium]